MSTAANQIKYRTISWLSLWFYNNEIRIVQFNDYALLFCITTNYILYHFMDMHYDFVQLQKVQIYIYRQTSNTRRTLIGNKLADR